MDVMPMSKVAIVVLRCIKPALLALAIALIQLPAAHAQDDDAAKILKAMSDYVASQKSISLSFDTEEAAEGGVF